MGPCRSVHWAGSNDYDRVDDICDALRGILALRPRAPTKWANELTLWIAGLFFVLWVLRHAATLPHSHCNPL